MDKLKIELTQEQTQYILNVLDLRPHVEVRDIIDTILQQANEQVQK